MHDIYNCVLSEFVVRLKNKRTCSQKEKELHGQSIIWCRYIVEERPEERGTYTPGGFNWGRTANTLYEHRLMGMAAVIFP